MEEIKQEFEKIYDQYVEKIYRFIYLKVSSQEIAEDLSSEVFVRIWESHEKGRIQSNVQAYIYQVARNVVVDHYREKGRFQVVSVEKHIEVLEGDFDIEEQAGLNMEMERVQKALADLSDDYQNYIIWRYLEELSVPEVAQITGKSEESVRVGTHRALQALKGRLEPEGVTN